MVIERRFHSNHNTTFTFISYCIVYINRQSKNGLSGAFLLCGRCRLLEEKMKMVGESKEGQKIQRKEMFSAQIKTALSLYPISSPFNSTAHICGHTHVHLQVHVPQADLTSVLTIK